MPNLARAVNIEDLRVLAKRRCRARSSISSTAARKTRSRCARTAPRSSACACCRACWSTYRRSIPRSSSSARRAAARHRADRRDQRRPLRRRADPGARGKAVACFTMATPSAFSIEVAEEVGGRLWFQLYAVRDRAFRSRLVNRAKAQATKRSSSRRPSGVGQARTRSAQRLHRPTARTGAIRKTWSSSRPGRST